MKAVIEEKLRELWQASLDHNDPQTHVVIHLLLAHKLQNSGSDFAKWCCQYNSNFQMKSSIEGGREILPGERPDEFNFNSLEYIN